MNRDWHAVQVLTNHEKRVTQHLASRCIEHYLPTYMEKSKWTDRTVTLHRPLFPGYVFIRQRPESRLLVLTTPGVLHLLGNETDGAIPSAEIERIREALAQGYGLQPHPTIAKGMRVRLRHGIFEGVEGKVTEVRGNCRVVLALSGVDQCFSLAASIDEIELITNCGIGVA
jgi:transcription antitermination factor NusG